MKEITFDDAICIAMEELGDNAANDVFFYMDELAMTPIEALRAVGL